MAYPIIKLYDFYASLPHTSPPLNLTHDIEVIQLLGESSLVLGVTLVPPGVSGLRVLDGQHAAVGHHRHLVVVLLLDYLPVLEPQHRGFGDALGLALERGRVMQDDVQLGYHLVVGNTGRHCQHNTEQLAADLH